MRVYIKGLNICPQRRQNLLHYKHFLEKNGHELLLNPQDSEVILVWTCGFREDVIENSITELNRYRVEFTGKIIALGCLPDIDMKLLEKRFKGTIVPWKKEGKFFEEFFGADAGSFAAAAPVFRENAICDDAAEYRRLNPSADAVFHDQFFKLQTSEGCIYHCTYCTEKLAFPPHKSISKDKLVEACRIPVEQHGQHRIMLLSDSVGTYGRDIGSSLPTLIRSLHSEYPQTAYALSNFHPINFLEYFDDMKQFIQDGWILHLNLPIQSASDKVLSAMNRQYTRKDLEKVYELMINLNFNIFDTHIIVGFPGETEGDFMETIDFLRKYKPKYALVSKYYDSPSSQSSKLGSKVDSSTMNRRLKFIENEMKKAGMVYNVDGGDLLQDRLSRINNKGKVV